MANGRSLEDVKAEEPDLPEHIARQKVHPGGRPSTFLSTHELTPDRLGALIALYEHGRTWPACCGRLTASTNGGVERGKTMATRLKPALRGEGQAEDAATARLIEQIS